MTDGRRLPSRLRSGIADRLVKKSRNARSPAPPAPTPALISPRFLMVLSASTLDWAISSGSLVTSACFLTGAFQLHSRWEARVGIKDSTKHCIGAGDGMGRYLRRSVIVARQTVGQFCPFQED